MRLPTNLFIQLSSLRVVAHIFTGAPLLEIAVFVVMAIALSGVGIPAWLFWMSFGVNLLFMAALTVFMFTFKIDKLF